MREKSCSSDRAFDTRYFSNFDVTCVTSVPFERTVLKVASCSKDPPPSEFFHGFGPVGLSEEELSGDSRVIDETVRAVLEANDYYELFQLDISESQIMDNTYDFSSDDFRFL